MIFLSYTGRSTCSISTYTGIFNAIYFGMKPLPKLFLVCAAMLAFSHNASAVTTDLTFNDGHRLGFILPTAGPPFFSDADKTALVNHLIGQALSTPQTVLLGTSIYFVLRSNNDFGSLPGPAVIGPSGTGTNITIGSGIYSYLFATYGDGPSSRAFVWYIGDLSGDITIPADNFDIPLTGWTLFGPGGQGVPDGGTTVSLLGCALLGLAGLRRRLGC